MSSSTWRLEVLTSWEAACGLRDEWDALAGEATSDHPFFRHDWFSCWYPAYAPAEGTRVLLLRQGDGAVRAIFPGYLEKRGLGGLPVRCLCLAANGHSPCGGIIARAGDREAIRRILQEAIEAFHPTPHLLILPDVPDTSDTAAVIRDNGLGKLGQRVEHEEEVPVFALATGWDDYFAGRSASTRSRLRQSQARGRKLGRLEFEEFATAERADELLARLRRLDARTWQGRQATGIFSNPENVRFYGELLGFHRPALAVRVYLATIGGQDAAYSITMTAGAIRYVLKYGYDPDFAYCRPGALTMRHVGERAAAEGMRQVDLGAGFIDDKRHWETHRWRMKNWWLPCRTSVPGCALDIMLKLNDRFRRGRASLESVRAARQEVGIDTSHVENG